MTGILFQWDFPKAEANKKKHGVAFDEASTVFADTLAATKNDPAHSIGEERFITMGISKKGRLLVVCHADRGRVIRIISARRATAKERKKYESD